MKMRIRHSLHYIKQSISVHLRYEMNFFEQSCSLNNSWRRMIITERDGIVGEDKKPIPTVEATYRSHVSYIQTTYSFGSPSFKRHASHPARNFTGIGKKERRNKFVSHRENSDEPGQEWTDIKRSN